jgi:hypothetical protein
MKPIGYYLSVELPQDIETIFKGLPYAAKIDVGRGIISTARLNEPSRFSLGVSTLEDFVESLPYMERVRLGAALIMVAVDEFDQKADQKRRGVTCG